MAPRNIYLVHCIELYYTARTHTTADQHHSSTLHHETLHDIAPHRTINSALNYASHYSTIQHATSDLYYTIYHTTAHLTLAVSSVMTESLPEWRSSLDRLR